MKRKILLILLGLIVLSQIPFAYRRYRLRRLHNAIQQLGSQSVAASDDSEYIDYQGVIHVHSSLGGHSSGSFAEIVAAAKANQLDFVIMTEHPQADFDTSAITLNGLHAGVLFVNGNEVATANGDRLLLVPGMTDAASINTLPTAEIVNRQKATGGLSFAAYPANSQNWEQAAIDGVEVYNLFTNAQAANRLVLFFDGLWSYGRYPDLMFANFFARPSENLKRWDAAMINGQRKLSATAGNDAHSNVGLSLNDASGKQWWGVKLDPYERSFRVVRTHVLIPRGTELSRESLLEALAKGHSYLSFDIFADGRGFNFTSSTVGGEKRPIMGDEVAWKDGLRLAVNCPVAARVLLLKDGAVYEQKEGSGQFSVKSPGTYRVEVYLDSLPAPVNSQPWIVSNPIYVR